MSRKESTALFRDVYKRERAALEDLRIARGGRIPGERLTYATPRLSLMAIKVVMQATEQGESFGPLHRLFKMAGIEIGDARHRARLGGSKVPACNAAEVHWKQTLGQINETQDPNQPRVSVYHDSTGLPLAIRKQREVPSALTLQPLEMNDVTLPSGTIVGIGLDANHYPTGSYRTATTRYDCYQVSVPPCRPSRLSAWAYDGPERALFACAMHMDRWVSYSAHRESMLTTVSIDDFRLAALTVMELCDVPSAPIESASAH